MGDTKESLVSTQIRIPSTLHRDVRHAAVDMDKSMNGAIICLLQEALEARRCALHNA